MHKKTTAKEISQSHILICIVYITAMKYIRTVTVSQIAVTLFC